MTTIQLHLPDDLASKAVRISGNIETLIIDLLRTKINELDKPVTLADEYRLAGIENKSLITGFQSIDMEGWDEEY